jgi:hypothetical protein
MSALKYQSSMLLRAMGDGSREGMSPARRKIEERMARERVVADGGGVVVLNEGGVPDELGQLCCVQIDISLS